MRMEVSGKNITVSKSGVENKFVVMDNTDMANLDNGQTMEIRNLEIWARRKN